jgi:hypothetical protein
MFALQVGGQCKMIIIASLTAKYLTRAVFIFWKRKEIIFIYEAVTLAQTVSR